MDKSSMDDLCHLIELYKGDVSFSKYLLTNLLEKMKLGKKLDYESFLVALMNSLQHKDYLKELVDTLFRYEQFHVSNHYKLTFDMLVALMDQRLYEHEQGRRLIKTIQLQMAMRINNDNQSMTELF